MRRLLILLFLLPLMAVAQISKSAPRFQEFNTLTGAENLMQKKGYWKHIEGKRVALIGNQTSVVRRSFFPDKESYTSDYTHLLDTLMAEGVKVVRIFCPEHGFRGNVEAGAVISNDVDAKTGIPIVSLYGKNKKPQVSLLKDVDIVLFDLQDVGCRFYTYISTLTYVMEACAEAGVPLMVLDRPNPNRGYIDGPVLEPQYRSFVGLHAVPIVYGMTIGEYGRMVLGEHWLWQTSKANKWIQLSQAEYDSLTRNFTLIVVPLLNSKGFYKIPVYPSPNLQTDHAIAFYPSLCLFEGTKVSVGRGTPYPFEVIGSPTYYNTDQASLPKGAKLLDFTPQRIKGVSENPLHRGMVCHGLDLRGADRPHKFDLTYIIEMHDRIGKMSFYLPNHFFDQLAGTTNLRLQLDMGMSEAKIRESWNKDLSAFKKIRERYLLYP